MEDEDSILPRKLQVALEHILEQRNDLACDQDGGPLDCVHGKCQGLGTTGRWLSESRVRRRGWVGCSRVLDFIPAIIAGVSHSLHLGSKREKRTTLSALSLGRSQAAVEGGSLRSVTDLASGPPTPLTVTASVPLARARVQFLE